MSTHSQAISRPYWLWPALAIAGAGLALVGVVVLAGQTWSLQNASLPDIAHNISSGAIILKASAPKSATLTERHGMVEVRTGQGVWTAAGDDQELMAGQSLRTGVLSSADLVFYDGSRAHLGPAAELTVDTLDAATTGPRIILLTQVQGESAYTVVASTDPASRFQVNTPAGSGSTKGTRFAVLVTPARLSRFWVEEGSIAVTNANTTVVVIAGKIVLIFVGQPPSEPFFRVTGEGKVLETGEAWNITGQPFQTNSTTVIVGNPRVGDWVQVLGHELPDGSRLADQIALVRSTTENLFAYGGKVGSISDTAWVITGRTVQVTAATAIEPGLAVGANVAMGGYLTQGGAIMATRIRRMEESSIFEFAGVVQNIAATTWTISDRPITVTLNTRLEAGLANGSLVTVKGHILNDRNWVATSVTLAEAANTFEMMGLVESLTPWQVAGAAFDVADFTEIDEGLRVGNRVRVMGVVRADGTWVAEEIQALDTALLLHFNTVGQVASINPWVLSGVNLTVNSNTIIRGEIAAGDMVKVQGVMQAGGTWLATEIKHTGWHLGQLGCLSTGTVVMSVNGSHIVLLNGDTIDLNHGVTVEGELKEASVVLLHSCASLDGVLAPFSLTVLYPLDALPRGSTTVPSKGEPRARNP